MPSVSIVRLPEKPFDDEVFAGVDRAIELLGGAQHFARAGELVLVKPNWWCWPSSSGRDNDYMIYGTTDRRVVFAVARAFVKHGCKVMIGEDPAVNRSVKRVYEGFRAAELAEKAGAELVNLRAAGYRTVPAPHGREFKELRISSLALDADLIVSVPVMKAHQLTGMTLTMKNMKGILPSVEKRAFHQRNLSQGLADLASVIRPALTVVDAIIASDNWVAGGGLRAMGLIVAGDDAVATDATCCRLAGADPYNIDHLRYAHEMALGELDGGEIQVLGEPLEEHILPFTLPADPLKIAAELDNIDVIVGQACSGCLNRLGNVFSTLGKEMLAEKEDLVFVIGKGCRPLEGRKNILLGSCLARYKDQGIYLQDCPPMEADIIKAIHYSERDDLTFGNYWDEIDLVQD